MSRIHVYGGGFDPGPDETSKIVKVLVEFDANQELGGWPQHSRERPITARECGANHPYEQVRAFFSDRAGNYLHDTPKIKPGPLHIGRTWMLPSPSELSEMERDRPSLRDHIHAEGFFNSFASARTFNEDQELPDTLDLSLFPVPNVNNQPHASRSRTQVPDGPWSPSNMDSLIASFSVANIPDTPPAAERSTQVIQFPQLNKHFSEPPIENEAGKLWAAFGEPKGHQVAEDVSSSCYQSEKNSPPETKYTKTRGKNKWRPLEL